MRKQPLAGYVLAKIQVAIGDIDAAREILVGVHDDKSPDERVVGLLAAMRLQAEDFAGAESLYRLGQSSSRRGINGSKRSPSCICIARKNRSWPPCSKNSPASTTTASRSARSSRNSPSRREDWLAAERWAKDAMFIDLGDAQLHAQLAEACANQKKWPAAIEEYLVAIELDADQPAWRLALADAHVSAGQKDAAKKVLMELLELSPKFPGADVMLEQLK